MNVVYKDAKVVKLEITLGTRNLEDLTFLTKYGNMTIQITEPLV